MNGKYRFRVGEIPIKPYVVVGAGMYSFKEKFEVTGLPTEDATATKAGGHGGLGASYMVNEKFGIGAEGN